MTGERDIKCNTCGKINPGDSLFCSGCISALNVKKISDLTSDDLAISTIGLIDSLSQVINVDSVSRDNEIFISYLSAFWLRPETALYQAAEASIVSTLLLQNQNDPFLDIGCGNGVNTSLIAGWRFMPDFDVFSDLDLESSDIYDSPLKKKDQVSFLKTGRTIDYGIDIKESMVQRARSLGTFKQVLKADVSNIPVDSNTIGVIYSNVLRDFKENVLSDALRECQRLLKTEGSLIFPTPTKTYRDKLYHYSKAKEMEKMGDLTGARHQLMLDRGRSEYCAQQISIEDWEDLLTEYGFEVVNTYPLSGVKLTNLWDTGLRPYTPLLVKFLENVSDDNRYKLKQAIVDFLTGLLYEVLEEDTATEDPAFLVIHAKKL